MVMPCSRSALNPSVSRARSVSPERCTPARWSCSTVLVSTSRRPISVLLPSSTEPHVMNLRAEKCCSLCMSCSPISEVAVFFALFHRRIGGLVVHARGAALADFGGQGLDHDLLGRGGIAFHRAGAGDVAHGAEAHITHHHLFAILRRHEFGHR